MFRILVIHGPNLNLLGEREPDVYGSTTLRELDHSLRNHAQIQKFKIDTFQSNHEGAIIDYIHDNRNRTDGIVINPGALTHYSYALRDAIAGCNIPAVEVHLSDIHVREDFRKISVIKEVCIAQISGKGIDSYFEGIEILLEYLNRR